MITECKKLEEYKKLLQLRYENLIENLMGREADYDKYEDRHHGIGMRTYTREYIEKCNISNSLKVRMAVEDFNTILKEVKKLAAK